MSTVFFYFPPFISLSMSHIYFLQINPHPTNNIHFKICLKKCTLGIWNKCTRVDKMSHPKCIHQNEYIPSFIRCMNPRNM